MIVTVSLAYIGLLFLIAYRGDRREKRAVQPGRRPVVYALSLAVYCSTWTFFGNVGSAATHGWTFLPIYFGPILALGVFAPVLRKILVIAKQQNTTSIADFIGARYGKSQSLAALVAMIALVAILPYIALQLKALTMSFSTLYHGAHFSTSQTGLAAWWADAGLYIAGLMAVFAVLFGTRHVNSRESQQGIILAIAFESLVKLTMFLAVGLFTVYGLFDGFGDLMHQAHALPRFNHVFEGPLLDAHFVTTSLLAVAAIFCLPREFHVAVVENTHNDDLKTARWLFPLYLLLMSLFVVPLAAAGLVMFGPDQINPDRFVLALPMAAGAHWMSLAVYIGGLSAGTGMVIVATVTLATMLCNEMVVPLALRAPGVGFSDRVDLSRLLIPIRRILIGGILLLSWGCYRLFGSSEALASFGLLAFSGVALFLPPLVGGLYIRGLTRGGVMAGLVTGLLMWIYTMVLPGLAAIGWLPGHWIDPGPFDVVWLKPQALFGIDFGDSLTHGVFWELTTVIVTMTVVSLRTTSSLIERAQALAFVDLGHRRISPPGPGAQITSIRVSELEVLLQRFLGPQGARATLDEYRQGQPEMLLANRNADGTLLQFAERRLAGVVGSASARLILTSGLRHHDLALNDMVRLLDQTAEAVQFNRSVLQTALENIEQGVSVIDQDLRLVAWNSRYLVMFDYPTGLVRTGRHVADLIRYNAQRGECGPGPVEAHVEKRLAYLRNGQPHRFERQRQNGTVLQMSGSPMPGGGFVTTFNDVSAFKRTEAALKTANEELEARVTERTAALSQANADLRTENEQRAAAEHQAREAHREAERANASKTRFLAAASHDLLQPINAARLFAASADSSRDAERTLILIQASLESAQELLEPLLDISRMDAGGWETQPTSFALDWVLAPLAAEFDVLARDAGLALRYVASSCWVQSDRALFRRILQNFLANAVRYTTEGRILFGVRRARHHLVIQVHDTGPGIPAEQLGSIFDEFHHGAPNPRTGARGLGLGLALADRMARLLNHRIEVRSRPGQGTVFALHVPRTEPAGMVEEARARDGAPQRPDIGTRIPASRALCIDDDPASLDALTALLARWGIDSISAPAADAAAIVADGVADIVVIDYDLGPDSADGLRVIADLKAIGHTTCILITAHQDRSIATAAAQLGVAIVYKPIAPQELRAAMARALSKLA